MASLLRTVALQAGLLLFCLCLLHAMELQLHEQQLRQQYLDEQLRLNHQQQLQQQQREHQIQLRRYSSTTSTHKPYIIPQGLSLPQRGVYPEKCQREVP